MVGGDDAVAVDPSCGADAIPANASIPVDPSSSSFVGFPGVGSSPILPFSVAVYCAETLTDRMDARDGADPAGMMSAMRRMAAFGPPISLENRMARHALVNQLRLSPEVYYIPEFGEVAAPPSRVVSIALLPTL